MPSMKESRHLLSRALEIAGLALLAKAAISLAIQLRPTPTPPAVSFLLNNRLRRRYRAPHVELDESLASHAAGPAEMAEATLAREDLRLAMAALTEEQQHVIALRFGRELPIQEVARTIGKSEGAVKQLQARAIAALARRLMPGTVE